MNELTRPGHYGEFFLDFHEQLDGLLVTYEPEDSARDRVRNDLVASFRLFCGVVDIADEYQAFEIERQRQLGLR